MKILGLDISSYIGMATIDNDAITSKLIYFKDAKGFKRLQLLEQSVGNTLDDWKPDLVIVEDYALGSTNNLQLMVEIGTVVRRQLYIRGIPWWDVRPTTLKLLTTGKGNATKPDMAKAVEAKWGFTNKSDDIIDAFALAKLGELIAADPQHYATVKGVKKA